MIPSNKLVKVEVTKNFTESSIAGNMSFAHFSADPVVFEALKDLESLDITFLTCEVGEKA